MLHNNPPENGDLPTNDEEIALNTYPYEPIFAPPTFTDADRFAFEETLLLPIDEFNLDTSCLSMSDMHSIHAYLSSSNLNPVAYSSPEPETTPIENGGIQPVAQKPIKVLLLWQLKLVIADSAHRECIWQFCRDYLRKFGEFEVARSAAKHALTNQQWPENFYTDSLDTYIKLYGEKYIKQACLYYIHNYKPRITKPHSNADEQCLVQRNITVPTTVKMRRVIAEESDRRSINTFCIEFLKSDLHQMEEIRSKAIEDLKADRWPYELGKKIYAKFQDNPYDDNLLKTACIHYLTSYKPKVSLDIIKSLTDLNKKRGENISQSSTAILNQALMNRAQLLSSVSPAFNSEEICSTASQKDTSEMKEPPKKKLKMVSIPASKKKPDLSVPTLVSTMPFPSAQQTNVPMYTLQFKGTTFKTNNAQIAQLLDSSTGSKPNNGPMNSK